jgi:hypothetical protein
MADLKLTPYFHDAQRPPSADPSVSDDFYEALLDTHLGLSEAQSALLNAKLILVLSNHIGDLDVLRQAMAVARADIDASAP